MFLRARLKRGNIFAAGRITQRIEIIEYPIIKIFEPGRGINSISRSEVLTAPLNPSFVQARAE